MLRAGILLGVRARRGLQWLQDPVVGTEVTNVAPSLAKVLFRVLVRVLVLRRSPGAVADVGDVAEGAAPDCWRLVCRRCWAVVWPRACNSVRQGLVARAGQVGVAVDSQRAATVMAQSGFCRARVRMLIRALVAWRGVLGATMVLWR